MSHDTKRAAFDTIGTDLKNGGTMRRPGASETIAFPANMFQTVAENASVGLYILQHGHFCYVNRWFSTILGYADTAALIGRSLWDLVHADDRRLVKLNHGSFGTEPMITRSGFRLRKKDGTYAWVHMRGTNAVHKGRRANFGHIFDITRLRDELGSLEASLKRHETTLDDVDVQLSELDFKGNLTFINNAGCRIWGLPREKMMGLNYRSYMDKETSGRFIEMYKEVYHTGRPIKSAVLDVVDKDGKPRTIEKSISLIRDAQGTITGFRNVTRDITARMKVENRMNEQRSRLEAIFSSVKEAIITVDPAMRVIEANRSAETICGISPKELTGKVFSGCSARCNKACLEVLERTVTKKSAIKEYLIECDHHKRRRQVVSLSTAPLLDPEGRFMGAVLVIRDMTLLRDLKRELAERDHFGDMIGQCKTMQAIYRLLEDLTDLETTVLVTGESGTGKELIARALHFSGARSKNPFITVNCAALSENLLESELFGHIKGAFTGAVSDKRGRFQAADGGTILLDEIGDISPKMQVKLLRVLQEKEFERVGETIPQKVNVRVIACTNQNLKEKVLNGSFRQDLYYRLKVVEIALPPLRDRVEDLQLLVDHFLHTFNNRFGKKVEGVSSEVLNTFMGYDWPGNIRELEHVMEHAFVLCRGKAITLEHLPADIKQCDTTRTQAAQERHLNKPLDAQQILDALNRTDWNKAKAARLLGIGRRTIYRKIETFNLGGEQR